MDTIDRTEQQVEEDERQIAEFRKIRREFTERAALHKEARQNVRDITDYEHVVFEEMFYDLFKRVAELESLLKG